MYQYSVILMHVDNRYLLCICQCRISIHAYWYQVFLIHISIPITCYAYINIKYFWCMYQQRGRQMPRRAEAKRWQGACNDTIINMKYVFPRWKNLWELLTFEFTSAKRNYVTVLGNWSPDPMSNSLHLKKDANQWNGALSLIVSVMNDNSRSPMV